MIKINPTESSDDYFCDEKVKNIPAEDIMQGNPLDILLFMEELEQTDDDVFSNEYAEASRQI